MKLKYFIWVFLVLFTVQGAFAEQQGLLGGLIGYWDLDDISNTADNLNGTDLTFTVGNSIVTPNVTGIINTGFGYDTAGYSENISTDFDTDNISLSFWWKTGTEQDNTGLIGHWQNAAGSGEYAWTFNTENTGGSAVEWIVRNTAGSSHTQAYAFEYEDDTWRHIVATYDGTSGEQRIYIDGNPVANYTHSGTLKQAVGIPVFFGRYSSAGHDGDFDEIGIWEIALNQTQVDALYNGGSGLAYPFGATPPPPAGVDAFVTESAFSTQFTDNILIGAGFGTVASQTITITNATQQTYYTSTITTNGTAGSTTAECQISLDGNTYGSTRSRTITTGTRGNFHLTTTNVTLAPGNYSLSTECQKTGGPGFTVTGTTQTGHLLYDTNRGLAVGYQYNEVGPLTFSSVFEPLYNMTYTTGQNWNATSTNELGLMVNFRASPSYTSTGNISLYLTIDGEVCGNYTRYGSSGSVGSIGGVCLKTGFVNGTSYDISLFGRGTGGIDDGNFHIKELVQNNNSMNTTTLKNTGVNSASLVTIASLEISNIIGGNYNIFLEAGTNIMSDSGSAEADLVLKETSNFRNNLRTLSAAYQPGNVMAVASQGVSGTGTKTVSLLGSCSNSDCTVDSVDFVAYATDAATTVDNIFQITAYDLYNKTTIQTFNATIGGSTVSTTNGTITIITNETNPVVRVGSIAYYENTTTHDRTADLNASLAKYTKIRVKSLIDQSFISNFTVKVNGTSDTPTTSGVAFVPFESGTYNISVVNVSHSGVQFSDAAAVLVANPYLNEHNFSVGLLNTINLSFVDEITEQFVNETVLLELISNSFAQNYSITNTTQSNISLLSPEVYTIRYSSASYTTRDYILEVVNGSFNTIPLYMITINQSDDLIATVEDTTTDRVENATISLLRYFVSCNCYQIVEMSKTSSAGQALFWVQAFDGFYKWSISYLDVVVFLSTEPENIVNDERFFTVNLGTDFLEAWAAQNNIVGTVTYDQATGALSFVYADGEGTASQGCLRVRYANGTKWEETESCVTGASGNVILMLDNTTQYEYATWVDTGGERVFLQSDWLDNYNFGYDFGTLGSFLGGIVLIGLSLMFSFSAAAVIIINAVGVFFLVWMELMPIATGFMVGLATLAIGLVVFLVRR